MQDTKEQARDVDVIADGIARFRGMDEPDATDRDEARAILAALAKAGLMIKTAPASPLPAAGQGMPSGRK